MKNSLRYVVYDARAQQDEDEATVLCVADTLNEAKEDKRKFFPDAVIFEYDVRGHTLVNGRRVI